MQAVTPVRTLVAFVLLGALSGCTSQPNDPCEPGRQAAARGDPASAIALWETESSDPTPKEKLRAVWSCLRSSGLAANDVEAARWIVSAAERTGGRAELYAGMLYASGAGVPRDLGTARVILNRALMHSRRDAEQMLDVLDATEANATR